ncbi:MAG: methionyl-tRNA formyltransferase [Firmicutes bacterium]|nr:methionyl-tRNA formyltransferase [Bacillota bacterium]
MKSLKLLFMGTPAFAIPALDLLNSSPHNIAAIVTQPDRLSGRGQVLSYSAVKKWAVSNSIETCQPEKLSKDAFLHWLENLKPDLIVTVAFGRMLSKSLLATPPLGCINLHASYLPAYRGAAPIHRAVIEGAEYSGVSIIDLTEELDGGDVYFQEKVAIKPDDTAGMLHDSLAVKGSVLLLRTINALADGSAVKTPQDQTLATYAPPLSPADEVLDWHLSSLELHNRIRGLSPWPGAYTTFKGKRVKVWKSRLSIITDQNERQGVPGTILSVEKASLEVATGNGSLFLIDLQPAGKKQMQAASFCCGYRIVPGDRLGDG